MTGEKRSALTAAQRDCRYLLRPPEKLNTRNTGIQQDCRIKTQSFQMNVRARCGLFSAGVGTGAAIVRRRRPPVPPLPTIHPRSRLLPRVPRRVPGAVPGLGRPRAPALRGGAAGHDPGASVDQIVQPSHLQQTDRHNRHVPRQHAICSIT